MKTTLVCCLVLGFLHLAFSSAQWPNEPAGSVNALDCPFSNSICSPLIDTYRTQTNAYASFANAPGSPPYVLDSYLPAGSTVGNGTWMWETMPFPKEIYVGFWWSTNADFIGNQGPANKMIFVRNSAIDNNFLNWSNANTLVWSMQATYDNCGHPGEFGMCYTQGDGTGGFAPNVTSGSVRAGTGWHQIEFYLKASTTKTSRDGAVRWWLDGQLVGNYPTVNMTPGGFREFYINSTWDGFNTANRDLTKSWHHYYDHLRISFPNGAPDPVMPLAITSNLQSSTRAGSFYTSPLSAANGTAPYGWTISAGSLPPGLTLNKTTGLLSGTPTTVGRSDFTVKVMDSSVPAKEATKAFTIVVSQSAGIEEKQLTVNSSRLTVESRMGTVRFHLPQPGAYALSVYDLAGKQVYEHKASAGGQKEMQIETALKNGIYLAKISQGQKVSTVRFNVLD